MNPQSYGPRFAEILAEERLNPLGPGQPNMAARPKLQALTVENAFAGHIIADKDMARACLAGIWLYHDFLNESHQISQEIDTTTGSYWHGIMHRREPDYDNSRYWFQRVGQHPIFEALRHGAAERARAFPTEDLFLTRQTAWDPFAFVDLCEASSDVKAACHELCRRVQQVEWELLFDYCYRRAMGE